MYTYDRKRDQLIGHQWRGSLSSGWHDWMIDELELGARAASAIGDPEQAWWNLQETFNREQLIADGIIEPEDRIAA